MSKADLIAKLMEKNPKDFPSKAAAQRTVDGVFDAIVEAVKNDDAVTIVGFGTFKKVAKAARTARNVQTGATIQVPAKNAPKFKAGKEFKAALN